MVPRGLGLGGLAGGDDAGGAAAATAPGARRDGLLGRRVGRQEHRRREGRGAGRRAGGRGAGAQGERAPRARWPRRRLVGRGRERRGGLGDRVGDRTAGRREQVVHHLRHDAAVDAGLRAARPHADPGEHGEQLAARGAHHSGQGVHADLVRERGQGLLVGASGCDGIPRGGATAGRGVGVGHPSPSPPGATRGSRPHGDLAWARRGGRRGRPPICGTIRRVEPVGPGAVDPCGSPMCVHRGRPGTFRGATRWVPRGPSRTGRSAPRARRADPEPSGWP